MKQCEFPHLESISLQAGAKLQSQSHNSTCPLKLWGHLSDDRILMNMARLSSSSSPFCPDYIYTMPYNSAQRDPQCSWATLLTFHKGGLITNLKWNQIWRVPFAYFTALNETPARNESAGISSIRLGFFGVGEGWHISKVYRLPLHLNGFMTIALILHDLMKTYWSRRIDTSAD